MCRKATNVFLFILVLGALSGCVGARTFHEVARAGDTVAVAAGWKHHFSRSNITVTITPSAGVPIVLPPQDPAVRAVVNTYPDPLSSALVSQETGLDLTPYAQTYALVTSNLYTNGDKDWWETVVFLDLPASLPAGDARIDISNPQGETATSDVQIVSGTGTPNEFFTTYGPLNGNQIVSMERTSHFTIQFSGGAIPHAIQVDLTHTPDVDHGGAGRAYVVNPRGDLKNLSWRDDGSSLRVILMPARNQTLSSMKDFKFYVTGGVSGLQVVNVKSFDINGNAVGGVTAAIVSE